MEKVWYCTVSASDVVQVWLYYLRLMMLMTLGAEENNSSGNQWLPPGISPRRTEWTTIPDIAECQLEQVPRATGHAVVAKQHDKVISDVDGLGFISQIIFLTDLTY
jgi:hypothetical protein